MSRRCRALHDVQRGSFSNLSIRHHATTTSTTSTHTINMHSLPTPGAMRCIGLKHKLPAHMRTKQLATTTPLALQTLLARRVSDSKRQSAESQAPVDQDLLASVLRVHLERKLRKERLRMSATKRSATPKAALLQRAVNSIDEPRVQDLLTSQHVQYGFQAALAQLRFQANH